MPFFSTLERGCVSAVGRNNDNLGHPSLFEVPIQAATHTLNMGLKIDPGPSTASGRKHMCSMLRCSRRDSYLSGVFVGQVHGKTPLICL